jgi:carboxyl-terminal processing protease
MRASLIALALGSFVSAQGISASDAYRVRTMMQSAYESVKRYYYDPAYHGLDWEARHREYQEKIKSAASLNQGVTLIAAFLDGLKDSHTYFTPPSRPYQIDYGYRIAMVGGHAFITRVRPETDAVSKVKPGDQVLGINGFQVTRESLASMQYSFNVLAPQQSVRLTLRDPAGQQREVTVTPKVKTGRQLRDLTGADGGVDFADLVRDEEASDHLLRQRYVEIGDVMIWKMPVFNLSNAEVDRMFGIARKHAALILDMRGNPGGLVDTLRRMVSNVLDRDIVIADRVSRQGKTRVTTRTRGAGNVFTGKLIVLLDSESGSAAEVFSRVVQLEERGRVLGDRSSGAVMEARQYPFAQGDETIVIYGVTVTSADLIMKDGKSLERQGVIPDDVVLPSAADLAEGRDPALSRAAALLGWSLDPVAAGKLFPYEWRKF